MMESENKNIGICIYFQEQPETAVEHDNSNNSEEMVGNKNVQSDKRKRRQIKKNEIQHDALLKKAANLLTTPVDDFQIFGDFVAAEM